MSDKAFMTKAAAAGIAEAEMTRLAVEKATHADVKTLAQHMLDDCTKATTELKGIAAAKKVTLPTKPDAKHEALIKKLKGLSGKAFDKAFVEEAVKAHKGTRALFQDEIKSGKDAEVKDFASKTLPVIEDHLAQSEKLAGSLK